MLLWLGDKNMSWGNGFEVVEVKVKEKVRSEIN